MCWWTDLSKYQYVRNRVDLRTLGDIIKNHIGDILGQMIYPERRSEGPIKNPYTMDNDIRPEIVGILIGLIEPAVAEKIDGLISLFTMYPRLKSLTENIAERKTQCMRPGIIKHSKFMAQSIEINVLGWHRHMKSQTMVAPGRVMLTKNTSQNILLFAETIVRAAQIYDETLMRNRHLWDQNAYGYTAAGEGAGFNWAFDMYYIELAIADLSNNRDRRQITIVDRD